MTNPKKLSPDEQKELNDRLLGAAQCGNTQRVSALLAAGADVHAWTDSALRLAAFNGNARTIQTLLASGADAHAFDDTALRWAADNGHTETVQTLLAAGADVHVWDDDALRRAATKGHTEMVQLLAAHIFAPDSWRGKSRAEIESHASALYDKIKTNMPSNPIKPERVRQAGTILLDCALTCWEQ